MKPFNLEAALRGEPVITRDGRPVKIAGYNPDVQEDFAILGWITNVKGQITPRSWSKEGKYIEDANNEFDLFMAANERKEWVVRYIDGLISRCAGPFIHIEQAKICCQDAKDYDENSNPTIHEITITE